MPSWSRLGYLQFYDEDTLMIDLIPCYRKADNVIGMYDLVNDKFYTNEGTGTFLKGKDVNAFEFVGDKTKNELDLNNRIIKNNSVKPDTFIDFTNPFIFTDFAPSGYNLGRVVEFNMENGVITWSNRVDWYGIGISFKPKVGVAYKVSYTKLTTNSIAVGVACYSNGYFTRMISSSTFTLEDGETDVIIGIRSDTVSTSSITNIQVEKGTTATEYQPFGYIIPVKSSNDTEETITNIILNEPLRKIGDYADYIDFKNKKVVRNIYYEFINTIRSKSSIGTIYSVFLSNISKKPIIKLGTGYAMSDRFYSHQDSYGKLTEHANSIQTYITSVGANVIAYTFGDTSITTVDQAQELMGDGFDVYYALETPIEETIELPNIPTLKGTTVIEIDTKLQPSNVEVVYKGK